MARLLVIAAAILPVASACAHTRITTNDPRARIYVDGEMLGRGDVEYSNRTGPPRTMLVVAKGDRAKVSREVKREFTFTTLFAGLFTYFTGFLWAWQYPENIVLFLPVTGADGAATNAWDEGASVWEQPPAGWGP